jgi:hypothetical protein
MGEEGEIREEPEVCRTMPDRCPIEHDQLELIWIKAIKNTVINRIQSG